MLVWSVSDQPGAAPRLHLRRRYAVAYRLSIAIALVSKLSLQSCDRAESTRAEAKPQLETPGPPPPPAPPTRLASAELWNNGKPRVVSAAWYDVPDDSLAARRAGEHPYTAAHNRLPIGTLVRVTHLANRKSVLVRITDRGITDSRVQIDLCKEAANEIGMIRKGLARVRMQVVVETAGGSSPEVAAAAQE